MGFLEVLTIVLVVLKLLGISAVASCSWWIVFSPIILAFVIYISIFAFAAILKSK